MTRSNFIVLDGGKCHSLRWSFLTIIAHLRSMFQLEVVIFDNHRTGNDPFVSQVPSGSFARVGVMFH